MATKRMWVTVTDGATEQHVRMQLRPQNVWIARDKADSDQPDTLWLFARKPELNDGCWGNDGDDGWCVAIPELKPGQKMRLRIPRVIPPNA